MNSNRRTFLKQGSALAAASALPVLTNLAAIGRASAQGADGYKALVCIFLTGGNDQSNTLIPLFDYHHAIYRAQRPDFYIRRDLPKYGGDVVSGVLVPVKDVGIVPIPKVGSDYPGLSFSFPDLAAPSAVALETMGAVNQNPAAHNFYGLAPSLTSLHSLYQEGVLAPVLNVGPLVEPTVAVMNESAVLSYRKAYNTALSASLPPKIGSHNDQQMYWQSLSVEGATQGWGGLMMSFLATPNAAHELESMYTSPNQVWSQGGMPAYQLGTGASVRSRFDVLDHGYKSVDLSSDIYSIMRGAEGPPYGNYMGSYSYARLHKLRKDLMDIARTELFLRDQLADPELVRFEGDNTYAALSALANPVDAQNPSDRNGLAAQLRSVAHVIRLNSALPNSPQRQVFFVSLGGFDTHGGTIGTHDKLLQHLGQAMLAFHRTLQHENIRAADNVVTFTASDFGRTLSGNGDGSDHGWGGHHFVMGGAVQGGTVYGLPPQLGDKAPNLVQRGAVQTYADNGRGRLIPTISVDQYGATLAQWMGVPKAQLSSVFHNLPNFDDPVLMPGTSWPQVLKFL